MVVGVRRYRSEKRAVIDAAFKREPGEAYLIEEPRWRAAIGAGLPVHEPIWETW